MPLCLDHCLWGVGLEIKNDFETAEECIEALEKNPVDVILMDIGLPRMDGIEATKMIRNMKDRSDATTIPIVAVTANCDKTDEEKSKAVKMNAHMNKPIEFDELISMVAEYHPKNKKNKIGG